MGQLGGGGPAGAFDEFAFADAAGLAAGRADRDGDRVGLQVGDQVVGHVPRGRFLVACQSLAAEIDPFVPPE